MITIFLDKALLKVHLLSKIQTKFKINKQTKTTLFAYFDIKIFFKFIFCQLAYEEQKNDALLNLIHKQQVQ